MGKLLAELRVSNDAIEDAEELKKRLDDEGYLFFRKLQNPDKLWNLRLEILNVCREGGWLQTRTNLAEGIVNLSRKCTEGDLEYTKVYHEIYKLESFHQAGHWPIILETLKKLIASPILPLPQKIARLWFPRYTKHTTPIHQDFVHFQGNFNTLSCWTALGDCPIELGGLAILTGSHKVGTVHDHHFSLGAGGLAINSNQLEGKWVTTNYEIGDTLIFPSLTVHQALPNKTSNHLRISLDNRYQTTNFPIAEHMLTPHLSGLVPLDWKEVYQDWKSEELKYYWHDLDLKIIPKNENWSKAGFQEALSLAKQGDPSARLHLKRIIKRAPLTIQASDARKALKTFDTNVNSNSSNS